MLTIRLWTSRGRIFIVFVYSRLRVNIAANADFTIVSFNKHLYVIFGWRLGTSQMIMEEERGKRMRAFKRRT